MEQTKILFVMNRKILSDALIEQAKPDRRFELLAEDNYALAVLTAEAFTPDIVVIEVPESGQNKSIEDCLAICDSIHDNLSDCKGLLICSENDSRTCKVAIQAKRDKRIDDFFYYDSSMKYLISKLESLIKSK